MDDEIRKLLDDVQRHVNDTGWRDEQMRADTHRDLISRSQDALDSGRITWRQYDSAWTVGSHAERLDALRNGLTPRDIYDDRRSSTGDNVPAEYYHEDGLRQGAPNVHTPPADYARQDTNRGGGMLIGFFVIVVLLMGWLLFLEATGL